MLVILMTISCITCSPVYASDNKKDEKTYVADNFQVTFEINDKWDNNFNGNIIIKNTGDKTIENWTLKFVMDAEITNMWNANVLKSEEGNYLITNAEWNNDIEPNQEVSFGFTGTYSGEFVFPNQYSILGAEEKVSKKNYEVNCKINDKWDDGYTGNIEITNLSDKEIEDWKLAFDMDKDIENVWNAKIISSEDNKYVLENAGHNANIKCGQSVSFGFEAVTTGAQVSIPENYELSEVSMEATSEVEEEIDYEKDTDGDGLVDYLEKELGTKKNEVDTDGDGLLDGYEVYSTRTEPLEVDSDNNGVTDDKEDFDEDKLDNLQEQEFESNPWIKDSDFEGLDDYKEYDLGTNPNELDTDEDGLTDYYEIIYGTNPLIADTDGDGLLDSYDPKPLTYTITDKTLALVAGLSYNNLSKYGGKQLMK